MRRRHRALVARRRIEVVADDQNRCGRTRGPRTRITVLPGAGRPGPARAPRPVPDPPEVTVPAFVAIGGLLPGGERAWIDRVRAGHAGRALHLVRVVGRR